MPVLLPAALIVATMLASITSPMGDVHERVAAQQLSGSAQSVPALPSVERHCANVTCNFYFSKSETNQIQKEINKNATFGPLANLICTATGPGAPACAAGINIHMDAIKKNVKDAAARRGCFVLRFNTLGVALGVASPAAISFGNVAGSHQFCKP